MKKRVLTPRKDTTPQMREYVIALKKGLESQHVLFSTKGKWMVKRAEDQNASKVFNRQTDAISYGKKVAQSQQVELFIHRKDGRIRGRSSYSKNLTSSS